MFRFRLLIASTLVFMGSAAVFIAYGNTAPRTLYITPQGAGGRDGSSWETAGTLSDLPTLVARAGAGGRVLLRADLGAYKIAEPIPLNQGGSTNQPVTVEGVDSSGNPMKAMIVGTRSDPYSVDGAPGSAVFRLEHGANHLRFEHLSFRNQGNGCFHAAADIRDLVIEHVDAKNVRRFLEDLAARTAPSATIDGLTIRNVEVKGFSKGAVRLQYNTHGVLMEDVVGDSERQDGDNFSEGVSLEGTVHDVVFRRVTMRNSQDTLHEYWNGDGFATERNTYHIRFEDTVSSGNTDAGYDLKSDDTVLIGALAEDNKKNYKMWGRGISISNCVGRQPHVRGGTGGQDQVEITPGADVVIAACKFSDSDPSSTIFHVEAKASLTVLDTSVMKDPAARLSLVVEGGALIFKGENW
jgi:hypothetical protein